MNFLLVTYHKVFNYGSSLQAYASKRLIEKLGCDVEILNYVPQRYKNYGSFKQTFKEKAYFRKSKLLCLMVTLLSLPSRRKQKKVFSQFDPYLNLGAEVTPEEINQIPQQEYDGFITGSDQVWNNHFGGFERAFFLDFVKDKPCFAYSASFGKDCFSDTEKKWIADQLKKYDRISLRESSGANILRQIGMDCQQLIDPIYVLSAEEWSELAEASNTPEDYILVYQLNSSNHLLEQALKLKELKQVKNVVVIEYERRRRDKRAQYISLPKVTEFLGLFQNARYVVTDSFHGTSFSIKFNRDFFVVLPPSFQGRINSILSLLNLETRILTADNPLECVADRTIDWKQTNQAIDKEAAKNTQFMLECIQLAESRKNENNEHSV